MAAASPRAAHYSSVTGEADAPGGAKSRTGLRRADSPPATPPPRAAVSGPKESCGVCAREREKGREPVRVNQRKERLDAVWLQVELWTESTAPLLTTSIPRPGTRTREVPAGATPGKAQP